MVKLVHHHSSCLIVESESGLILLDSYDDTYPIKDYRGRVHLIGGSHDLKDESPSETLTRELSEEFSIIERQEEEDGKLEGLTEDITGKGPGALKPKRFADVNDIKLIKDCLLNFKPYSDFLIKFRIKEKDIDVLISVFKVKLDNKIFEIVKRNIDNNLAIKNEGIAKLIDIQKLISGKEIFAWSDGLVLGKYKGIEIPNSDKASCVKLGVPKDSYQDYLSDFSYEFK